MALDEEASKKLYDSHVTDLKSELEKRDLDEIGVESVLTEKLQKEHELDGMGEIEEKTEMTRETMEVEADDGGEKTETTEVEAGDEGEKMETTEVEAGDGGEKTEVEAGDGGEKTERTEVEAGDEREKGMEEEPADAYQALEDINELITGQADDSVDIEEVVEALETKIEEDESLVLISPEDMVTTEVDPEPEIRPVDVVTSKDNKSKSDNVSDVPASAFVTLPKDEAKSEESLTPQNEDNLSLDVLVDDTQNDLDSDLVTTVAAREESDDIKAVDSQNVGENEATKKTEATVDTAEIKSPDDKCDKVEKKPEEVEESKEAAKSVPKDSQPKDDKIANNTSRNLWVSGLASSTRATDLKTLFNKHGRVVGVKVVTKARSLGSRCYGFVTMSSAEEATKCIHSLHRTELHGKNISVDRAKKEPGTPSKTRSIIKKAVDKKTSAVKKEANKKPAPKKERPKKDIKKTEEKKESKPVKKDVTKPEPKKTESKKSPGSASSKSKPRIVALDKGKGEPVVSVKKDKKSNSDDTKIATIKKSTMSTSKTDSHHPGHPKHSRSKEVKKSASKDDTKKDVLSFDKIKKEKKLELLRWKERKLQKVEQRRLIEIQREKRRQRHVQQKQQTTEIQLEKERELLRKEKEHLEKEKLEVQRTERVYMQNIERERLASEREGKRRLDELRIKLQNHQRRVLKRTLEARNTREDYLSEHKRRALSSEKQYSANQYRNGRETRECSDYRKSTSDSCDPKAERYARKKGISSNVHSSTRADESQRNRDRPEVVREDGRPSERASGNDRGNVHASRPDSGCYDDNRRDRDCSRDVNHSRKVGHERATEHRDNNRDGWCNERTLHEDRSNTDARITMNRQAIVNNSRDKWQTGQEHGVVGRQALQDERSCRTLLNSQAVMGAGDQVQQRSWGAGSSSHTPANSALSGSTGWPGMQRQAAFGQLGTAVMSNVENNMYINAQQNHGALMNSAQMVRNQSQEARFDAYKQMSGSSLKRY